MREIKFRAWVVIRDESQLCVVDQILSAGGEVHSLRVMFGGNKEYVEPDEHKDHSFILEQFTGLKDKNGVEIYEGDIVRYRDDNTQNKTVKVANVYWIAWADWARVPFLHPFGSPVAGKDVGEGRSINTVFVTPPEVCEVIGNIHENPDLLK